jgi:hypothetical protein
VSFLDLYQNDQDAGAAIQPNEAHDLPATLDQTFGAAWSSGQLFSQSIAHENARAAVLQDYLGEIKDKTGNDLTKDVDPFASGEDQSIDGDFARANDRVAKLKQDYPDLDLAPLSDDEIDQRAIAKSRGAQSDYASMAAREKTAGGSFGMFMGGLASASADPINIVALPVAPAEGLGVLATALRWGAIAGTSQAAIEAAGGSYREQVQPGYLASGEPLANVAGAAVGGAVLGGSIKALGNAWTRVKTGQWPQSIRDAGNLAESEANIADTNVLPGVDGEVAHRDALTTATDSILNGEPVDVSHIITPEMEGAAQNILGRIAGERGMSLPVFDERSIRLISEEAALRARSAELTTQLENLPGGDPSAVDRLNRLQAVESQLSAEGLTPEDKRALNERRDQILVDTNPETLRAGAAPFEQARQAQAELASIESRLNDIKVDPFAPKAAEPAMLGQTTPIANAKGQFEMPLEAPESEADRVTGPEPVTDMPEGLTPETVAKTLASPDHADALRADIDRARMTGDVKVPVGIDEQGNVVHRSVDDAMNEVDAYHEAADQIASCAAPAAEAAE